MLRFEMDTKPLQQFASEIGATEEHARMAGNRSLIDLKKRGVTHILKNLSKGTKVTQKRLRKRVFGNWDENRGKLYFWVGGDEVGLETLGNISVNKRGVSVKGHSRRGAFVASIGGNEMVLIREASRYYVPEKYSARAINGDERNYPLRRGVIHIEDEAEAAGDSFMDLAPDIFEKLFFDNLKFYMAVKK